MAETIQTAIYRMGVEGAGTVDAAGASVDRLAVSEEKLTRATRTSADAMDRMLGRLDPRIRAEQQLQAALAQVNRFEQEGIGTATQRAQAIAAATTRYNESIQRMSGTGDATAAKNAAKDAAKEADQLASKAAALRAQIDPLGAAQSRYNAELAEYAALASRGAITTSELAAAQGQAAQRLATATQNIKAGGIAGTFLGAGNAAELSAFQMQNMSFQLQDIGQAIATGQPLFRTFIQQGSQLAQIFGPNVGLGGAIKALGSGIVTFISNPLNIAVLAFSAAAGAAELLFGAISGSSGESAEEALKRHNDLIDEIAKSYDKGSEAALRLAGVETTAFRASGLLQQIQLTKELRESLKSLVEVSTARSLATSGIPLVSMLAGAVDSVTEMSAALDNINVPQGFLEDAERFRQSIRDGSADVEAYRKQLAQLGVDYPTSENLKFIESEMKATKESFDVAQAITKLQAAMRFMAGEATAADRAVLGLVDALTKAQSIKITPFTGSAQGAQRDSMLGLGQELGVDLAVSASARERDFQVTLDKTRQLNELSIRAISARSPGEKASIAAERERISLIGENVRAEEARLRITNASETAAVTAGYALSEAQRERKLALDETLLSTQLDLDLIGESVGATEALRMEYQLTATLRAEAAKNGTAIDQAELALIRARTAEYGRLRQQIAETEALRGLAFERDQLGRTPTEQKVASGLRGIFGDDWEAQADGAIAAQIRFNEHLGTFRDLTRDAFGTFVSGLREGKTAVEALTDTLGRLADRLLDMALDQAVSNIFSAFTGPKISSVGAGLYHDGGIAGSPTATRYVHPAYFDDAPRYHRGGIAGLRAGEVAAILQRGERVIPRGGGGGGSPVVNVIVNSPPGMEVTQQEERPRSDGGVDLELTIDRVNTKNMLRPGTGTSRAGRASGLQPPLIRR